MLGPDEEFSKQIEELRNEATRKAIGGVLIGAVADGKEIIVYVARVGLGDGLCFHSSFRLNDASSKLLRETISVALVSAKQPDIQQEKLN